MMIRNSLVILWLSVVSCFAASTVNSGTISGAGGGGLNSNQVYNLIVQYNTNSGGTIPSGLVTNSGTAVVVAPGFNGNGANITNVPVRLSTGEDLVMTNTHFMFLGDSLTDTNAYTFPIWPIQLASMPRYAGVHVWNGAITGQGFNQATNLWFGTTGYVQTVFSWPTNGLTYITNSVKPGDTVILFDRTGVNDFYVQGWGASGATSNYIVAKSNFYFTVKSRESISGVHYRIAGFTVTTHAELLSDENATESNKFCFNNWMRTETNLVDFMVDASVIRANPFDDFGNGDGVHDNISGHCVVAREVDRVLRFSSPRFPIFNYQESTNFYFRNQQGMLLQQLKGNGTLNLVDAGGFGNDAGVRVTGTTFILNNTSGGAYSFRLGEAEQFAITSALGLTAPLITLTGTGPASSPTGIVFQNGGGSGNDVGIWREDGAAEGIFYKSGSATAFHEFFLGDTSSMKLQANTGNPSLTVNVPVISTNSMTSVFFNATGFQTWTNGMGVSNIVSGTGIVLGTNGNAVFNNTSALIEAIRLDGTYPSIRFSLNGVPKDYIATALSADSIIGGSGIGDLCLRSQGGQILLSSDGGTTGIKVVSGPNPVIRIGQNSTWPTLFGIGVSGNTNLFINTGLGATNGLASFRSNSIAPFAITAPATTVPWTNPINMNIQVYIDNSGVTGTAINKNGGQIFSSLVGDVTIGLQPNEYISLTYTIGTPVIKWSPF